MDLRLGILHSCSLISSFGRCEFPSHIILPISKINLYITFSVESSSFLNQLYTSSGLLAPILSSFPFRL